MKKIAMIILILQVIIFSKIFGQTDSPELPPIAGDWDVTFVEEFNDSVLNSDKWKIGQHWGGINGKAQPHQDNIFIKDGALVFKWDKKDDAFTFGNKSSQYGTGEVSTYKRFHQKYGYLECRIKYDVQRGLWPAFWTMPAISANSPADIKQAYLKFSLPDGIQSINNARLKIKLKSASNSGYWLDIYAAGNNWEEGSLTWNNKTTFNAIFLDHIKPEKVAGEWIEVDVTGYLKKQIQKDQTVSFMLADMYQQQVDVSFYSKEAGEENCPYLEINGIKYKVTEDAFVYGETPDVNYGPDQELKTFDSYGYNVNTRTTGMEIDIYEALGIWGGNKLLHAWHWDGYGDDHKSDHFIVHNSPDQDEFTTYGLYWAPDTMEFYVNGEMTNRLVDPEVCATESFLILSAQLGGWDGNSRDLDVNLDPYLPVYMYIDYVKVWSGARGLATSLNNLIKPENIKVTPNPVEQKLTIQLPGDQEYLYELYDLMGNKVQTAKLIQVFNEIDMGMFEEKMYLIKLQNELGKIYTFKIIKI